MARTLEEKRAAQRAWYAANKEKVKAKYDANIDEIREKDRARKAAWRAANPEKFRDMESSYREKRRAALALVREIEKHGIGALL